MLTNVVGERHGRESQQVQTIHLTGLDGRESLGVVTGLTFVLFHSNGRLWKSENKLRTILV